MKKLTLQLMALVFLTLIAPHEISALNDTATDITKKSFMIGLNFGGMVSDTRSASYFHLDNKHYLSSFTFGLSSTLQLTNFIDIKAGMHYERKGNMFPKNIGFFLYEPGNMSFRLHYLTIHQSILFNTRGRTAVYIGPGIYQAFLLQANHFLFPVPDNVWTGTPRFDFGANFHTGISHQLTPRLRTRLEITAAMGFLSIYKKELEQWHKHTINRSASSTVSLNYCF